MLFMICMLGVLILHLSTVWYFTFFLLFSNNNVLLLTDYVIVASSQSITRIHCPYYCAVHVYSFIFVIVCGRFEWKTKLSSFLYILLVSVLS